jgi:aldose 1-epimerase
MFEIKTDDFEGIEIVKLINTVSGEYASIIPSFGGNIHELVLQKHNILHDVIYTNKNKEELSGFYSNLYRGAKLNPFSNRIDKGTYIFENISYSIPLNDAGIHALHGFVWNKPFSITASKTSFEFATLTLSYTHPKDSVDFPFSYTLLVTYKLCIEGLMVTTQITNTSPTAIPMGDGWHPYLTLGSSINTLKLQIPSVQKIETTDTLIPTGKIIEDISFFEPALLGERELDNAFVLDSSVEKAETLLFDEEEDLTLVVWQQTDTYPFVHVYTPSDRMSVAIEPCSAIPDAFNRNMVETTLKPAEKKSYVFGIQLR